MKIQDILLLTFVLFALAVIPIFCLYIVYVEVPGWINLSVIFVFVIYYFDSIPLQHYWNPSIRRLYPHRQFSLERTIVAMLQRARLLPRQQPPQLPVEIWDIVLRKAIEIPYFFDTTCDSPHFHLFIRHQFESAFYPYEYRKSEEERKHLRLVCRMWKKLLDRHSNRFIDSSRKAKGLVPVNTARLHVCYQTSTLHDWNSFLGQWKLPGPDEPISASILLLDTYTSSQEIIDSSFSSLMGYSTNFRDVRHFIHHASWAPTSPAVLQIIQNSFPSLTTLIICASEVHGTLTLNSLEVLYLDAGFTAPLPWQFPALRHLGFGKRSMKHKAYHNSIVPGSTRLLQSLMLPLDHGTFEANDRFWEDYPKLEFLGVSCSHFHLSARPPPGHPLSHLLLAESETGFDKLEIRQVESIVDHLPQLKAITMPEPAIDESQPMYPLGWVMLFRRCQNRGLIWKSWSGDVIRYRKQRPDARLRIWEWPFAIFVVGYAINNISSVYLKNGIRLSSTVEMVHLWLTWIISIWLMVRRHVFGYLMP